MSALLEGIPCPYCEREPIQPSQVSQSRALVMLAQLDTELQQPSGDVDLRRLVGRIREEVIAEFYILRASPVSEPAGVENALAQLDRVLENAYQEATHGPTANAAFIDLQVTIARKHLTTIRRALVAPVSEPEFRVAALRLAFDDGFKAAGGENSHHAFLESDLKKRCATIHPVAPDGGLET